MEHSQEGVIAFLWEAASYGLSGREIERHETHGAIVFLAGDRAWKLKRAVRYPYMDYSTVEARKEMCSRELAVNRRTAPELYLSVRPIVRGAMGQLEIGCETDARKGDDWVVEMRRFEQSHLLANMLDREAVTRALMRELAETIADFHRKAETTRGFRGAAGVRAIIDENPALLGELCPDGFRAHVELFNRRSLAALENLAILLDRRRDAGRVRRCHGDLHLNNICMIDGRPVFFDAIEFNDSFACIDVLYDLAFPMMNLMHRGLAAHASTLLNRYLERTGDHNGLAALPLFIAGRAGIRAHVAVSRAQEMAGIDAIAPSQAQFRAYVELGMASLERGHPRLIAIGGVSGAGKSTLAYGLAPGLAPTPGAIVLRSDVIRKAMMNVPETQRLRESAYTNEMHERIYLRLNDKAASILSAGYSVIVDAVFGDATQRDAMTGIARKSRVPFAGIWLEAASAILEHRVAARRGDASDATIEILRRQLTIFRVRTIGTYWTRPVRRTSCWPMRAKRYRRYRMITEGQP